MNDLPNGYRWATDYEVETGAEGMILIPRTVDANGNPYFNSEADLAIPIDNEDICEHGMSAWLCMGPNHYPTMQDEMEGRYF